MVPFVKTNKKKKRESLNSHKSPKIARSQLKSPPTDKIAAISLGLIHPAAATDGQTGVVFSAKLLRNMWQYTIYKYNDIIAAQARYQTGLRRWQRLEDKKNHFLGQQVRQLKDIEHKVSAAMVDWLVEKRVGTVLVGNMLGQPIRWQLMETYQLEDGKPLPYHLYPYLKYKAHRAGITVAWVTHTVSMYACPACGQARATVKGVKYCCSACAGWWPVDIVAANYILRQTIFKVKG